MRGGRESRVAVAVLVTLLALELGLLAVGVPAHLSLPGTGARSRAPSTRLGQLGSLDLALPRRLAWARLSVLMLLVPAHHADGAALLLARPRARRRAAIGRPRDRRRARAVRHGNAPGGAWRRRACCWRCSCSPGCGCRPLRGSELGRALGWTLACALAALDRRAAAGRRARLDPVRALEGGLESAHRGQPAAAANAFTGTRLYGPIGWSRSHGSLLTVRASEPARPAACDLAGSLRRAALHPLRLAAGNIRSPTSRRAPKRAGTAARRSTVGGLRSRPARRHLGHHHARQLGRAPGSGRRRAADGTLSLAERRRPRARATRSSPTRPSRPRPAARRAAHASPAPTSPTPSSNCRCRRRARCRAAARARGRLRAAERPLVRAPALGSGGAAPGSAGRGRVERSRRILASPYGPMYGLARQTRGGRRTSYEVVARIERYLSHYTYDEHPPLGATRWRPSCSPSGAATASSSRAR